LEAIDGKIIETFPDGTQKIIKEIDDEVGGMNFQPSGSEVRTFPML
jgi:hypothetical protein